MDGRDREGVGEGSWWIRREGDVERDQGGADGQCSSISEPGRQGGSHGATRPMARPRPGLGGAE